jgi:ABC-type multidrug transport system ATPase subunit
MFGFVDRPSGGGTRTSSLWTPVSDLSGGERRRLQMLRLLASEPNVLLFDEPTNDLDTDTLASLEDLLDSWPGTLVVASHDRYLVERVTDVVFGMFGDGRLVHLPGGVDEYLARVTGAAPAPAAVRAASAAVPAEQSGMSAADVRAARKDLVRLERAVSRLTEREAVLHDELATHSTDYAKVADLDARLRELRAERERAEEEWLALAEQVDAV